ncbi:MAG: phospholipase D-like domain-containing protein [Candidatus Manganitrophus sp.]|nr:phospholipase D-like domain-containing protein [Candidatus Manganitrophus sp.]WDT70376.1 MAG: phospholipase D-like domain-containing protein [Candidatus Manganitrophus sp.]
MTYSLHISDRFYHRIERGLFLLLMLTLVACGATPKRLGQDPFPLSHPAFFDTLEAYTGPPILPGHRVRVLLDGDEAFPAMLKAIREAEKSITFVTYVYWKGKIADEFAEALARRARDGLPVYLLLDSQGAKTMEEKNVTKMKEAGVHFAWFRPMKWYKPFQYNYRTHRKVLVIDGRIGFTGGIGIGDEWLGHAQDKDHWRDTCVVVEGPVVHYLQAAFAENWLEATRTMIVGDLYFPPPRDRSGQSARDSKLPDGVKLRSLHALPPDHRLGGADPLHHHRLLSPRRPSSGPIDRGGRTRGRCPGDRPRSV